MNSFNNTHPSWVVRINIFSRWYCFLLLYTRRDVSCGLHGISFLNVDEKSPSCVIVSVLFKNLRFFLNKICYMLSVFFASYEIWFDNTFYKIHSINVSHYIVFYTRKLADFVLKFKISVTCNVYSLSLFFYNSHIKRISLEFNYVSFVQYDPELGVLREWLIGKCIRSKESPKV